MLVRFVSLLILLPAICVCQSKEFLAGNYVNNNGDTVTGFISLNEKGARGFKFKINIDGQETLLAFNECKSITTGENFYVMWHGTRKLTHLSKNLMLNNSEEIVTELIPLKRIYYGKRISLSDFPT